MHGPFESSWYVVSLLGSLGRSELIRQHCFFFTFVITKKWQGTSELTVIQARKSGKRPLRSMVPLTRICHASNDMTDEERRKDHASELEVRDEPLIRSTRQRGWVATRP